MFPFQKKKKTEKEKIKEEIEKIEKKISDRRESIKKIAEERKEIPPSERPAIEEQYETIGSLFLKNIYELKADIKTLEKDLHWYEKKLKGVA